MLIFCVMPSMSAAPAAGLREIVHVQEPAPAPDYSDLVREQTASAIREIKEEAILAAEHAAKGAVAAAAVDARAEYDSQFREAIEKNERRAEAATDGVIDRFVPPDLQSIVSQAVRSYTQSEVVREVQRIPVPDYSETISEAVAAAVVPSVAGEVRAQLPTEAETRRHILSLIPEPIVPRDPDPLPDIDGMVASAVDEKFAYALSVAVASAPVEKKRRFFRRRK